MSEIPLAQQISTWILSDGKAGDETQSFGIAEALGLSAQRKLVAPRWFFALAMPYGPIDWRDLSYRANSPIAPPFPEIAIAAGRRTVAYLRHIKRASNGATFTVFLKDPYVGTGAADVIWVPQHDRLRGANVVVTATPAHRMSAAKLAAARRAPDARIAALQAPRAALILGGPSTHHRYSQAKCDEVAAAARRAAEQGFSVMVTGSRRTPQALIDAVTRALRGTRAPHFIWDGSGANPYAAMLALADAVVVTGDSVNMMAEAAATGAPVHILEPDGGHAKMTAYIDHLVGSGAARRWSGTLETWTYAPIDATPLIAAEIARRYQAWRIGR